MDEFLIKDLLNVHFHQCKGCFDISWRLYFTFSIRCCNVLQVWGDECHKLKFSCYWQRTFNISVSMHFKLDRWVKYYWPFISNKNLQVGVLLRVILVFKELKCRNLCTTCRSRWCNHFMTSYTRLKIYEVILCKTVILKASRDPQRPLRGSPAKGTFIFAIIPFIIQWQ